jgi:acyl carrier protein
MTKRIIRQIVADALNAASIPGLSNHLGLMSFISGDSDIQLSSLEMDSLGKMEFCIYIEIHHGVSIVPDRLDEFKTLDKLAAHIEVNLS